MHKCPFHAKLQEKKAKLTELKGENPEKLVNSKKLEVKEKAVAKEISQKVENEKKNIKSETNSEKKDKRVHLNIDGGKPVPCEGSKRLLREIGGSKMVRKMCIRFYEKFFKDSVLTTFRVMEDGPTEHGSRFADWLVEQMGGEGTPATDAGRGDRLDWAHIESYYSKRRAAEDQGKKFVLHDARIWMRLFFLAGREMELDKHKGFWRWIKDFINFYIDTYQMDAPQFTEESAEWSADKNKLKEYVDNGCEMKDIIGFEVETEVSDSDSSDDD
mmetsp:Transcript_12379/g.18473  ORF Transcript_12379/g.18473 Transcript_12379/m.18473 type:complete len:272 (-) Transcript_12379:111-926(-)|eukprot:CAMPEP_0167749016 /NCGR_PEP_ID=MMETSP0110_2-20121227/5164_1 /TAXON_ID=629695 /ORGANISM="Gymnochlora sp., Strain CCMP2014" /LENGTH=271 /DNA_ID=CAMNT_0007634105 /DNA_START=146 /DNA_END=961 /DNA_ORIENTATION=+